MDLAKYDPISFLVNLRYPLVRVYLKTGILKNQRHPTHEAAAAGYRTQLEAMSAEELKAFQSEEVEKHRIEREAAEKSQEEKRFFNGKEADADYEYWTKAAYWTLDEAVALTLGKSPGLVNAKTLQAFRGKSEFVLRYDRLWSLVNRAKRMRKLYEPTSPARYVGWAMEVEIELPKMMREKIVGAVDWKELYERRTALSAQQSELLERAIAARDEQITTLESAIASLQREIAGRRLAPSDSPEVAKSQSGVERDNMLKVIFAMAVDAYGYEPNAKRSPITKDILNALHLAGLSVSDDTIRRYLKAAQDKLPEWLEDA